MTTANLHGWEFLLPQDVEVVWDGISDTTPNHVTILQGQKLSNGQNLVETGTANATISFNLNAFLDTDQNHYSLLMGPPNHFVQGAKPMSALIRSDWYKHTSLNFCWQLTTPNKPILFKKDTPFMYLINYPKNLLETTELSIKAATNEQMKKMYEYSQDRNKFYEENPQFKWASFYKKGIDGSSEDANHFLDEIYRPIPKQPVIEINNELH